MSITDWYGSIGVTLLLIAFLLNLLKKISLDSTAYTGLNVLGAAIACYASVMLVYWPFIILEAIWTIVSAVALVQSLRKNKS